MKLYLWKDGLVLKNYRSGVVLIAADTPDQAWEKLKAEDYRAFMQLTTGHGWIFEEGQFDPEDDGVQEGFPIQPVEYELDQLPAIVQWGGE